MMHNKTHGLESVILPQWPPGNNQNITRTEEASWMRGETSDCPRLQEPSQTSAIKTKSFCWKHLCQPISVTTSAISRSSKEFIYNGYELCSRLWKDLLPVQWDSIKLSSMAKNGFNGHLSANPEKGFIQTSIQQKMIYLVESLLWSQAACAGRLPGFNECRAGFCKTSLPL